MEASAFVIAMYIFLAGVAFGIWYDRRKK